MPSDRFLIAPTETGLQTNLPSWLLPDDAFAQLIDAYVWRGRIRKRFGSRLMGSGASSSLTAPLLSRTRIQVGTITSPISPVPGDIFKIGQMFSAGDQIFTVYQTGTPAAMLHTGVGTGTFNTTSGAFALTATGLPGSTPIYFYPSEPIMGLTIFESGPINNQPSLAFDTQFAYLYTGTAWQAFSGMGSPLWHGGNNNFFWTSNWQSNPGVPILFVSNFFVTNPNGAGTANDDYIWSYDGTTWTEHSGTDAFFFAPGGGAPQTGPFVVTARIVVVFQNQLLLLNTIENDGSTPPGVNTHYPQRFRWSFRANPFSVNAWYQANESDNAGNFAQGGGFDDFPTTEQIISAEFIKNRLIVYCERSTWEIVYTANTIQPFRCQKINTELGSQATFSTVPFDQVVLTMGTTGVHACNGSNVERIDQKIPDTVFDIEQKNLGIQRVVGIRDYYTELVYWTYPSFLDDLFGFVYPNRILVFNYRNGSWAIFEDNITFFGYFNQQPSLTWQNALFTWETANQTWDAGSNQQQFRSIIAGNQQGFIYILDADATSNAQVMQITNVQIINATNVVLTIVDATLKATQYLHIKDCQGITGLDDGIFEINTISVGVGSTTVKITVPNGSVTGSYTGGGTAAIVSNPNMLSKQWNPYVGKGRNFFLRRIDFCVQRTTNGEITVDYYPSSTNISMLEAGEPDPEGTGAGMGNGVLETKPADPAYAPLEQFQQRIWHPVYFQTLGEFVQIRITMTTEQILQPSIAFSPLVIEGMVLHTQLSSANLR